MMLSARNGAVLWLQPRTIMLLCLVLISSVLLQIKTAHADPVATRLVQQTYLTYYGRAADSAGLNFWLGFLAAGNSPDAMRAEFGSPNQPEFVGVYGDNVSDDMFFDRAYQNILNRMPDAVGKTYWVGEIERLTQRNQGLGQDLTSARINARVEVLNAIVAAGLENARDGATITNKLELAVSITERISSLPNATQTQLIEDTRSNLSNSSIYDGLVFLDIKQQVTNKIAEYTDTNSGSLTVTLEPAEARAAGAQWRRTGTSTWRNSDTTESGIPTGGQTVEFKAIGGWIAPSNAAVTITAGGTATLPRSYTRIEQVSGVPELLLPQNNAVVQDMPDYRWTKVDNATWYLLQIQGWNTDGSSIETWSRAVDICPENETGCQTKPNVTSLPDRDSRITWRVRVYDGNTVGAWSNQAEFNFERPPAPEPGNCGPLPANTIEVPTNIISGDARFGRNLYLPSPNAIHAFRVTIPSQGLGLAEFVVINTSSTALGGNHLVSMGSCPGDETRTKTAVQPGAPRGNCWMQNVEVSNIRFTTSTDPNAEQFYCVVEPGRTYYFNVSNSVIDQQAMFIPPADGSLILTGTKNCSTSQNCSFYAEGRPLQ